MGNPRFGKTRKVVSVLSGVLLFASLLAGCGGSNNNDSASDSASSSPTVSASPSESSSPSEAESSKPQEKVTLSVLTDNSQDAVNVAKVLMDSFHAKNPNITLELETRPSGGEGDNFVKTRLSTGDMNDVFFYNTGSLMQALNPEQNILDVTNEPWQADVIDSFKQTVTFNGKQYGAPTNSTMGGAGSTTRRSMPT